jgi:hypothetical protein
VIKLSRNFYLIGSGTFIVGVMAQVFLAGMVVVAGQMGWVNHRNLGHSLALPLLVMLISAYPGRLPKAMKGMTWTLFVVYILQADVLIFLRGSAPAISALHPVMALIDFALGVALVQKAWSLTRRQAQTAGVLADLEPAATD